MDNTVQLPVPFPSLAPQPGEPDKVDDLASGHSRVHSSPTSPNPWLLGYPKSRKKLSVTSSGSPRRSHVPLTPPLTPSSSFNSASGNESSDRDNDVESNIPSTPPESPLRQAAWNALQGKRRTTSTFGGSAYMSPVSGESDVVSREFVLRRMNSTSSLGTASPAGSVDSITPRMEKTFKLDAGESDVRSQSPSHPKPLDGRSLEILMTFTGVEDATRFLLLRNIPPHTPYNPFIVALSPAQDVKGVHLRFQKTHGVVILAFYDVRRAKMTKDLLNGMSMQDALKTRFTAETEEEAPIEAVFVTADHIDELIPNSEFVVKMSGVIYVTIEGRRLTTDAIRGVMASYGDLIDFALVESNEHQQKFRVEYFNVREATTACALLKERSFFGSVVRTCYPGQESLASEGSLAHLVPGSSPVFPSLNGGIPRNEIDLTSPVKTSIALPGDYRSRPRSVSAGSHDSPRLRQRDGRRREHERDSSLSPDEELGMGRLRIGGMYDRNVQPPPSPSRRRSLSMGPEPEHDTSILHPQGTAIPFAQHNDRSVGPGADSPLGLPYGYGYDQHMAANANPYASQYPAGALHSGYHMGMPPSTHPVFHAPPLQPQQLMPNDRFMHPGLPHVDHNPWTQTYTPGLHASPGNAVMEFYPPPGLHNHPRSVRHTPKKSYQSRGQGQNDFESAPSSPTDTYRSYQPSAPRTSNYSTSPVSPSSASIDPLTSFPSLNPAMPADATQKNQLDLAAIEKGIDTRTTVMVKNIPNKMTDKDLLDFIGRVCPRKIDFLYLRMDFQNGCNVGYAFVNFITVQDLLHFASTQLGVKWNMYSSEKYLQLSYANYQGKEALVEKFKNSCIMDEREAWRPKIFFSSGPNQGLPEPFPAPTHLRRKERSAHNRGALFVPGPGSQHHHIHHGHHGGRGGHTGGMRQVQRVEEGVLQEFRQYPPRLSA